MQAQDRKYYLHDFYSIIRANSSIATEPLKNYKQKKTGN